MNATPLVLVAILATGIAAPGFAQTPDSRQLAGAGALEVSMARTADRRFAISASLVATPAKMSAAGFALTAQLIPDTSPKAVATLCAVPGNDLFRNGFEN